MGALTSAIPGFGGLNNQASDLIKSLMSGQLTTGTKNAIYDAGAERATLGGMPGSTGMGGSLFANGDLRNIGRAADDQQQRGFQDLLSLLQGYSGTVAPSAGQELQDAQFNKSLNQSQNQFDRNYNLSLSDRAQEREASAPIKLGDYSGRYGVAAGGLGGGLTTEYKAFSDYLNPKTGQTYSVNSSGSTKGTAPRLVKKI
jgi:hypothetical protein